jgi:hypothetical protein
MGYGKLYTTFAVEFDTNSNSATADPYPPNERHISITYKEKSSNLIDNPGSGGHTIAWNDMPFNFNNPD